MARGRDKHQERLNAVGRLGRSLARRSGSACELCSAKGTRLDPWEVPPAPADEPDIERTLLLCERCRGAAAGGKLGDAAQWRFLDEAVWNELQPAQVTAVRLLRRLSEAKKANEAKGGAAWAAATLEGLYLSPEVEEWLGCKPATRA